VKLRQPANCQSPWSNRFAPARQYSPNFRYQISDKTKLRRIGIGGENIEIIGRGDTAWENQKSATQLKTNGLVSLE
jgi:hypothetical protein